MSYPELKMLIGGDWTDGSSGNTEPVFCPADGSIIGTLPESGLTPIATDPRPFIDIDTSERLLMTSQHRVL